MSQLDEVWIFFLIIVGIMAGVFAVLRQSHAENYSGTVSDVPRFNIQQNRVKGVSPAATPGVAAGVATYEEIEDDSAPALPHPSQTRRSQARAAPPPSQESSTFDKDVHDPSVYMFRSHVHVPTKSSLHIGADLYRGDLNITPVNRGGHFQSKYGTEVLRHDTYFSESFNKKYSADYQVVNEELVAR